MCEVLLFHGRALLMSLCVPLTVSWHFVKEGQISIERQEQFFISLTTFSLSLSLPANAPPAPSNLQITPTPTSATISWSVIPPEAFVREYQLNYTYMGTCPDTEGLSFSEIVRGGAVTSHTLLDLVGNSFYTGYLTAFNDGGRSEDVSFNFSTTTSGNQNTVMSLYYVRG